MKTALFALIAVAAAALVAAVSYAPAAAQETRDHGKLFGRGEDGPYDVSLYGLPENVTISKFGFTVTVESVANSTFIDDAKVEVVAIDPDGEPEWLSPALSFPPQPTSYVGNAPRPPTRAFSTPGEYLLEVRVDGPEGRAVVRFPIAVAGSFRNGSPGALAVFAGAIAAAVSIGLYATWKIRRAQRLRRAGHA